MKQHTTPDQTAKLIELGFEKPKGWYIDGVTNNVKLYVNIDQDPMMFNYSIGELIEKLPSHIKHGDRGFISYLSIAPYVKGWKVAYTHIHIMLDRELIDALYDMAVLLKEEGVI